MPMAFAELNTYPAITDVAKSVLQDMSAPGGTMGSGRPSC